MYIVIFISILAILSYANIKTDAKTSYSTYTLLSAWILADSDNYTELFRLFLK